MYSVYGSGCYCCMHQAKSMWKKQYRSRSQKDRQFLAGIGTSNWMCRVLILAGRLFPRVGPIGVVGSSRSRQRIDKLLSAGPYRFILISCAHKAGFGTFLMR